MRGQSLFGTFLLLALLLLFAFTPARAQVCFTSDASAAAYDDVWQNGDNDGTGFGPWFVGTTASNPNNGGFGVWSSTVNGDGDTNADGDIDTGGRAWGLYANSGEGTLARRSFTTPLVPGSVLSFRFDNGWIDAGGANVEINLENSGFGPLMRFSFIGGDSEYRIYDAVGGGRSTGVAFTDEGLQIDIELVTASDYTITITPLDGSTPAVVSGILNTVPGGQEIAGMNVFNRFAGLFSPRDLFINSLQACYPEPDTDNDGVGDVVDLCPGTVIPEGVPTLELGINHFALIDGDQVFDTTSPKGMGPGRSYTTEDTGGCSCEQIIAEQNLGDGHTKQGCSISAMDDWVAFVNGAPKRADAAATANEAPQAFSLDGAYPNPFNPETTIRFFMPEAAPVRLAVFDMLGRTVRVLVDGVREAGQHVETFDAEGLPSGSYLYHLETPRGHFTKTMVLLK